MIESKLQEIVDRHEIWQVLQRYGRGLDRLDQALVRSCYFDDAIDDHGIVVGGVDKFIEWANGTTLAFVTTQHGVMNHYCELKGDDAHAETYFTFIGVAARAPHLMSIGRYVDHFQRRRGEWRIANRVTIIEKAFDLSDCSLGTIADGSQEFGTPPPATRDRNDVSYQRPLKPRRPAGV